MVRICTIGREELGTLVPHVDLGLADSEFNRLELEALGFRRTGVLPIYLDFRRYREAPGPVLRRMLDDGRTNLLFVGRLAPNKRPEDLIRLASYWKRFVSPDVRLVLVGKPPRRLAYFDALQALAYEEGFTPWEVVFLGHVSHEDLLACYSTASLFVSMSEHEGFGVPLVESMLMGVPVLAYGATAVPHTLGGAGVQFSEKRSPRDRGGRPRPGHRPHACAARCWRARSAASRPSPRRPSRARCGGTWTRCEPAPRGRLRRSALRPRRDRWLREPGPGGGRASRRDPPDHGVHHLRPGLRDLAKRAARRERGRRADSRFGASGWRRSGTSTPSTPSPRRSTTAPTTGERRDRVAASPGTLRPPAGRDAARGGGSLRGRGVLHLPLLPDRTAVSRRRPSGPSWSPPPTTSRP